MEAGGPTFSVAARAAAFERMGRETFDLLVLGGGITGAGVARDGALRGLAVALVEAGDFGGGTSSRSSRLVHGGLRYLRQGRLGLVREASRERAILRAIAPHLVRPVEVLLPVYRGVGDGPLVTALGLWLYAALAGRAALPGRRRLGPVEVLALEPALAPQGLRGGGLFGDCQVDDARLVLATVRSAWRAGAAVANYAPARRLLVEGGRAVGAVVADALGGGELPVRARLVVAALGPWADALGALGAPGGPYVGPTKGVHLVLRAGALPVARALALWNPEDGRLVFVLPWGGLTLVGTTDTPHAGDPGAARVEGADVEYLLRAVNRYLRSPLSAADVQAAYAGVRPLLPSPGGPPSARSREHRIAEAMPGLLVVVGGKLTTHRLMAAETVDRALAALGLPPRRCTTHAVPLEPAVGPRGALGGLPADVARHLREAYGGAAPDVAALARSQGLDRRLVEGLPYLEAEALHAARHEMVVHLEDFLRRRTGIALEAPDHGRGIAPRVAELMAPALGWGPPEVRREVEAYHAAVEEAEAWRKGGG